MNSIILPNSVWNVSRVNLFNRFDFPTTDDHSKWAVSDEESEWICVGDINRAVSCFDKLLLEIFE